MHELLQEGIILVLLLSCTPIACVALVSGVVAAVQAMTQIQEQTVTHLVKVVTCAAVMYVGGVPAFKMCIQLLHRSLSLIEALGQSGL